MADTKRCLNASLLHFTVSQQGLVVQIIEVDANFVGEDPLSLYSTGISGVTSFFLRITQYNRIYQEALEEVIYSKKFLANRTDLQKIWENACGTVDQFKPMYERLDHKRWTYSGLILRKQGYVMTFNKQSAPS